MKTTNVQNLISLAYFSNKLEGVKFASFGPRSVVKTPHLKMLNTSVLRMIHKNEVRVRRQLVISPMVYLLQ